MRGPASVWTVTETSWPGIHTVFKSRVPRFLSPYALAPQGPLRDFSMQKSCSPIPVCCRRCKLTLDEFQFAVCPLQDSKKCLVKSTRVFQFLRDLSVSHFPRFQPLKILRPDSDSDQALIPLKSANYLLSSAFSAD